MKLVHSVRNVALADYVFDGQLATSHFDVVPLVTWPNGLPCNEVNLFVLRCLRRKLSTAEGGSVQNYVYTISRLVRYCYVHCISLTEVTDKDFTELVKSLREPTAQGIVPSERTVVANGRLILGFIAFLDETMGGIGLLGRQGKIKAVKKRVRSNRGGRTLWADAWQHSALGTPSPERRRKPITKSAIDKLNKAAETGSTSNYLVRRRQLLLRLLEIAGPRVGEVARLKVSDVRRAAQAGNNLLSFYTLKRRKEHKRQVPVLTHELSEIINFIDIQRRSVIRKTVGRHGDDGAVFVSERTGRALSAATLSNEVGALRRHAGISERAHAHMFRHRFITRTLYLLIDEHKFQTEAEMRTFLFAVEDAKTVLAEWTGHADPASLEHYIHAAFSEWRSRRDPARVLLARHANEYFSDGIGKLAEELYEGLSIEDFRARFIVLRDALNDAEGARRG